MTRVHDRPRVREHDDAIAEKLIREAFPETEAPQEPPIVQPPAETEEGTPERPIRWMRWLAGAAGVIALVVVAAVVINRDEGTAPTETAAVTEFHTADWYEHMLTPTAVVTPTAEFHTADWYEHMLTPTAVVTPTAEFHTADWYEHMLTPTAVVTPTAEFHTADWYEHMLS
jgi:hypothetical protein